MNTHYTTIKKILFSLIFCVAFFKTYAQPSGFSVIDYAQNFPNTITVFDFAPNGLMYACEKGGKIYVVMQDGSVMSNPILDISEEVIGMGDFGILGLAFDPAFMSNGYFYIFYTVDRHYLLNFGTPNYDTQQLETTAGPTIARVVRYQADVNSGFMTLVPNSRQILIGESISTGIPLIANSVHAGGCLVFGSDGTLMVSTGDGSYVQFDGDEGTEQQTALDENIITIEEKIGTPRVQLTNSLMGKILRIDPSTGDGIPSNPLYDSNSPRSAASRLWARGIRNGFRFSRIPGTGSNDPSAGNPGHFILNDVGNAYREEINMITEPNQNFGWPYFEGNSPTPWTWLNQTYNPSPNQKAPFFQYRETDVETIIGGTNQPLPSGSTFPQNGNATVGSLKYTKTDFPTSYQNSFFTADFGGKWIANFKLDANNEINETSEFYSSPFEIICLRASPSHDGLFFVTTEQKIKRILYNFSGNVPPVAHLKADVVSGNSPVTVAFNANKSYDPEGTTLTYDWDFGDGFMATGIAPHHQFVNSAIANYVVTLTVTDANGGTAQSTVKVHVNNTPPTIISTSIDGINSLPLSSNYNLSFFAAASDAETTNLTYEWRIYLSHNEHRHLEQTVSGEFGNITLMAIDCNETATYWYTIELLVKDPEGLETIYTKNIYADCGKTNQSLIFIPIPNKLTTDAPFTVAAFADSFLPATYDVVNGPATIAGNQITLTGIPGYITVRAMQHGNGSYNSAPPIDQIVEINRNISSQTVSIDAIPQKLTTDPPFTVVTSASSGQPVACLIRSGPASINSSNQITLAGTSGTVTVRCYQAGNHTLNGAYQETTFNITACPSSYTIANGTIYNTNTDIKSSNDIQNINLAEAASGRVTFDAGKYILLQPGFKTSGSVVFEAKIGGCN
jgi:glucose/arabinose dehydrogenase